MPSVLITAFEPYDHWTSNASVLALDELLREPLDQYQLTTRVWPVDFDFLKAQLPVELTSDYDFVVHLGQSPGSAKIQLEAVGLNIGLQRSTAGDFPLSEDGPLAYRSSLTLADCAARIAAAGFPVEVSFHAGTYLCNAALYLSHYHIERLGLKTRAGFVHLPLDVSQVEDQETDMPCVSSRQSAAAVRVLLETLG